MADTNAANQHVTSQLRNSVEEKWVTIAGARMRHLRSGSGLPLLLVHGLLGYSFSWRFVIPALAQYRTVYAVDMLGAGFSERPENLDASLTHTAKLLLRFMDEAGLASADILGTSRGGATVMMAAALAPERVRRLILVDPVNPWSAHGKHLAAFFSNVVAAALFLRIAPLVPSLRAWVLRRLYGDPHRIRPGTLEGYSAPFQTPGTLEYALRVVRTWQEDLDQLKAALPRITHIPTLLIWGSEDRAVDPASASQLSLQFQDCRSIVFPGVGHLPYEEIPDEFNRVLIEFLQEPGKSQA